MFILSYLLFGIIVWGLALWFLPSTRARFRLYTLLAGLSLLAMLELFVWLSWLNGLLRVGDVYSLNVPGDYFALGARSILALALGVIGILSPLAAAWLVTARFPKPKQKTDVTRFPSRSLAKNA